MALQGLRGGAVVLAALTLVTAGSIGGATAARLIDSGDIKDGSIRKADLGKGSVGWSTELDLATRKKIRRMAEPTAWGRVSGFSTVSVEASSPNVSAALRSQDSSGYGSAAGSYCLRFDPPVPAERLKAAVVTGYYGSAYPVAITSTLYCNDGELGVLLFNMSNPGYTQNGDFNFFIP